jgi:hypothetical protein
MKDAPNFALTLRGLITEGLVVAGERPARRVNQSVVPGETLRVEPPGGVVQPAQQPGDGRQRGVGLAPVRIGRHRDLAVDEHEALASRPRRYRLVTRRPPKPACLTARRKAWIEPECGLEGRRTCGPTRTTRPAFAIPPHGHLDRRMVQPPAARRQQLARIGETRPPAKWFHRIGLELALCVSDVDHPNHDRLHGAAGYVPPIEYEQHHYRQINSQQQPLLGEPRAPHSLH